MNVFSGLVSLGIAAINAFAGRKKGGDGGQGEAMRQQAAMERRHAEMDKLRQDEISKQQQAIEANTRKMDELKQQHESAVASQKLEFARQLKILQEQHEKDQQDFRTESLALQNKIKELQAHIDKPVRMRAAKVKFVNSLNLCPQQNGKITIWGQKGNGKSSFLWLWGKAPMPSPANDDGTKSLEAYDNYIDTIGLPAWDIYYVCKLLVILLTHFGVPADIIVCLNSDRVAHALTSLAFFGIISPLVVVMTPLKLYEGLNPPAVDPFSGQAIPPDLEFKEENGVKIFPKIQLRKFYNADAVIRIRDQGMGTCITHQDDPPKYPRQYCPLSQFEGNFEVTTGEQQPAKELMFRFIEIYHRKYRNRPQGQLQFLHKAVIAEFDEDS